MLKSPMFLFQQRSMANIKKFKLLKQNPKFQAWKEEHDNAIAQEKLFEDFLHQTGSRIEGVEAAKAYLQAKGLKVVDGNKAFSGRVPSGKEDK